MSQAISHFELLNQLGEGGMGVVYKARDQRLGRMVALKLLPASVTSNPERQLRFAQEGKAASALNHPNIVTIYEIDTISETTFIAMEYIEGQTLAQRIPREGLALTEVLRYSIQIAEALSAAHTAGIVHRDLKPANIMITPKGQVKILDFGVAKLINDGLPGRDSNAGTTSQPTAMTTFQTEKGIIIGTYAYMSPEQAQGLSTDARSDVFSFGSVLYEMLTGSRAFAGNTGLSTMAAILHQEPKPLLETQTIPRDLAKIVHRCLRKDPERRFQVMADVRVALQEVQDDLQVGKDSAPFPPARTTSRWRAYALTAAALLIFAAMVESGFWVARHQMPAAPIVRFTRVTADSGLTTTPALSTDGKLIAYASDRFGRGDLDIWVQQTGGGVPLRLTSDEADDHEPAFSPDGSTIAFRSERQKGGIYVVPALGGEARLVTRGGHDPRFSPDGTKIAYWTGAGVSVSTPSQIYIVPAAGGEGVAVQSALKYARHPVWSADGQFLLFWGLDGATGGWWAVEVDPENAGAVERRPVPVKVQWHDPRDSNHWRYFVSPSYPAGWLGEQVVFATAIADSTDLWSIPLSRRNWVFSGFPQRLTSGLELVGEASTALSGQVVYANLHRETNVWGLRADGNTGRVTGELEQMSSGDDRKNRPALSRSGRKLAYVVQNSQSDYMSAGPIVVRDLVTGKVTSITTAPSLFPSLSADGSRIAFTTFFFNSKTRRTEVQIYVAGVNGEVPERVCADCGLTPAAWSSDGRKLLYDWGGPQFPQFIGMLDLTTRKKVEMLRSAQRAFTQASFSPDDRWICFLGSVAPERNQVYIAPFVEGKPLPPESYWTAITDGAGFEGLPRWSPDGHLIYFVSDRDGFRCIWAQRLTSSDKKPVNAPFAVVHLHQARRSLTNVGTIGLVGLGISTDRIVFNLGELTGNIWRAEVPGVK